MNVRNLLRKLIGLPPMEEAFAPWDKLDERITILESRLTEASDEIERLRNRASIGKVVRTKLDPSTWEEVVAAYAEIPEHFKEN